MYIFKLLASLVLPNQISPNPGQVRQTSLSTFRLHTESGVKNSDKSKLFITNTNTLSGFRIGGKHGKMSSDPSQAPEDETIVRGQHFLVAPR